MNLKKWLLGMALAVCAASVASADSLELGSGATNVNVPGSGGTTTYQNSNFDGWNILITFGSSNSPSLNPFGLDLTALVSCSGGASCTSNPLFIYYSDTGFTTPVAAGNFKDSYSATISGTGSGLTAQYGFASAGNGLFATDSSIGAVGPFSTTNGATITGGPSISGPYSLTLAEEFVALSGPVSFSTDASLTGIPTPEPSEAMMLGTGLFGLLGFARRKVFGAA
jgi:hypothetical protein